MTDFLQGGEPGARPQGFHYKSEVNPKIARSVKQIPSLRLSLTASPILSAGTSLMNLSVPNSLVPACVPVPEPTPGEPTTSRTPRVSRTSDVDQVRVASRDGIAS